MFFSFSSTEILYISSRVPLDVFRFSFSFCVYNGSEKKPSQGKSLLSKKMNDLWNSLHSNKKYFISFRNKGVILHR